MRTSGHEGYADYSFAGEEIAAGNRTRARSEPVPNWDLPALPGAGALRSSANDILTFLAANLGYNKTPLAAAMAAEVSIRRPTGAPDMQIAYAWRIQTKNGNSIIWHSGGTGGYRTYMGLIRRRALALWCFRIWGPALATMISGVTYWMRVIRWRKSNWLNSAGRLRWMLRAKPVLVRTRLLYYRTHGNLWRQSCAFPASFLAILSHPAIYIMSLSLIVTGSGLWLLKRRRSSF